MTADEKESLFIIKRIDGAMIAGFVLWAAVNILLYFIGSLLAGAVFMPKYLFFLILLNVIGGAIVALKIFLNESET